MKESIFSLSRELDEFMSSLPESGELSDEDMVRYTELEEKLDGKQKSTIEFYKYVESQNKIIEEEITRLKKIKQSNDNALDRLTKLLDFGLRKRGLDKVDFGTCSAKFAKNPHRVEIIDEASIPEDYKEYKEVLKIDKSRLRMEMREGKEIPGAVLVQDQKLRIN